MQKINIVTAILAGVLASSAAKADHLAQPPKPGIEQARQVPNRYAAYEFLIGDWYSMEGGNQLRQSLRWGPSNSYIRYSTYMQQPGKPEKLHFEGIMVWNGKTNALDYVFAVEPGSGVQEKGTVRAEADGSVVREVELTGPKGDVTHFRQRFWRTNTAIMTSLMRQTATGWEPSFPGAEQIVMKRRPG